MTAVAPLRRQLDLRDLTERGAIELGVAGPDLDEPLLLAELMNADRRLDVAQVVLEAAPRDLVVPVPRLRIPVPGVPADPVQAQNPHRLLERFAIGGNHPAFAGREVLGGVEAEGHGVAAVARSRIPSPDRRAAIARSNRVRGVFNDMEPMAAAQGP